MIAAPEEIPVLTWHNCYDDSWRKLIVPEAFAHPAKFAPGLIRRIYVHGLNRGWWKRGDLIGDPFGGIAGGGIMAGYSWLNWIGVELEERFVKLGNQNLALHGPRWAALGEATSLTLVQGDSRRFAEIVAQTAGVVTSPPYANSVDGTPDCIDWEKADPMWKTSNKRTAGRGAISDGYGKTAGQIGALSAGDVDAIVTSPPWEDQESALNASKVKDPEKFAAAMSRLNGVGGRKGTTPASRLAQLQRQTESTYGTTSGQLGNVTGETYWQAMHQVYAQCLLAMKTGGYLCVVVKDYVKDKKRVPLCDQTLRLLEHIGFTPVCRIHAMLVKERTHVGLFGDQVERKERKSFFRRLAEKKGSPRIDWEEVLVVRKGELDAA